MTTDGDDRPLMEHEYDGIQEFDNPMPRWWILLFIATIVFVPVYYLMPGDLGAGARKTDVYERDMAAFRAAHPAAPTVTAEELTAVIANPEAVSAGKTIFAANCTPCHRADGGGIIGPNLTDDYWIHGGTPVEIHKTITEGVLAKGMPPWGKMMKPEQIKQVLAYVVSLHGSNPPNPKPPQGVLVATGAAAAMPDKR